MNLIEDGPIRPMTALRTLGFAGRSEMLDLWRQLDADKQTLLLELAREMVGEPTAVKPADHYLRRGTAEAGEPPGGAGNR